MKNDFRNDGSQSWANWERASDEPEQDPLDGWKNYFYGIDLASHDPYEDQTAFCMISPDGLVGFAVDAWEGSDSHVTPCNPDNLTLDERYHDDPDV